jgi:PAS domain S-box-containing protein
MNTLGNEEMNVYTGFLLLSSVICLILGILVYQLNRKERLNKLFTLTFIFASYWALTDFLMRNSVSTNEAYFWNKTSFLWPFAIALMFHFSLVFTKNRLLSHRASYVVIYAPAVVLSIIDSTTGLISGPIISQFFGFTYSVPSNPFFYMFGNIWGVILGFLSLFVCIKYYYQIAEKSNKDPVKLVIVGFAIPFVVNLATTVIPPYFNINLPPLGNISTMFVSVFVGYAIYKHYLFSLNPALAAENIIDIMPDSLILTDNQGIILRVNNSFLKLTGCSPDELNGKSFFNFFIDEQQGGLALAALKKDKKLEDFEASFMVKSGEIRMIEFAGSAVESKQGQNLGFTCVVHDITEQKQMQEQLIKTERLASVGEAATMVGHDLANPLQYIRNATYLAKGVIQNSQPSSFVADMAKAQKMLAIIEENLAYADNIVLDLKDYTIDRKPLRSPADINVLINEILRYLKIPEGVAIKRQFKQVPLLRVDANQLKRVFQNLVENAVDAMDQNGTLTITTREADSFVEVALKDTGKGIPEEINAQLFKPFFTTKIKGMGIGLAICQKFVQAHNGTITVKSERDIGSTFTVRLPIDSKT